MKSFALLSFLFFIIATSYAQSQDVQVYEKKEGEKVIVIARNTGVKDYTVKITITSEGMDVHPSSIVEDLISGGHLKEMATITPRPGTTWSYGYEVSITQSMSKSTTKPTPPSSTSSSLPKQPTSGATMEENKKIATADPSLSDARIILYAKPSCGRCDYAKKQLKVLGIQYVEVDTHSNSPEVPNMWAKMRNQGFAGGSVTMPVVRVDGKYHYDIKDLEGFLGKLKG